MIYFLSDHEEFLHLLQRSHMLKDKGVKTKNVKSGALFIYETFEIVVFGTFAVFWTL